MKKLLLIAILFSSSVFAQTVGQCTAEHFNLAKNYPDIPYEKDREIVSIWCNCKTDQLKKGSSNQKALEYCTAATNKEINQYLKSKGKL